MNSLDLPRSIEAEKKAQQRLIDAKEALKNLQKNEDFKLLIEVITKDKVIAFNQMLSYDVEGRGAIFEELVWRSQLEKELDSILDFNDEEARKLIEGE